MSVNIFLGAGLQLFNTKLIVGARLRYVSNEQDTCRIGTDDLFKPLIYYIILREPKTKMMEITMRQAGNA